MCSMKVKLFFVGLIALCALHYSENHPVQPVIAKARQLLILHNKTASEEFLFTSNQTDHECFENLQRRNSICAAREWNHTWSEKVVFTQIHCCAGKPAAQRVIVLTIPEIRYDTERLTKPVHKTDFECFSNIDRRNAICEARGWITHWSEYSGFQRIHCCVGRHEYY